jgi:hypothetical protein
LVEGTPARQGQTYLRQLYDDVHHTTALYGKALYYSTMEISPRAMADLQWWKTFLRSGQGNTSPTGSMGSLVVTWGDGSGTGTGGTSETLDASADSRLETWMGTWKPHVTSRDSNWRELRTAHATPYYGA